jgi:riboflavin kinase / FMN adenylyltransferase
MTKTVFYQEGIENIGDAVVAIGAFDGVHMGHRYLIDAMNADASRRGCASVIVTFDIDPNELFLESTQVRKLLSNDDRIAFLCDLGVDYVYVIPFTHMLASLPYEAFLEQVLGSSMNVRGIHVGSGFRFGSNAEGDVTALKIWGKDRNCACFAYDLWRIAGNPVSATRIRELLAQGEVTAASTLLGRDHFMRGQVEHGRGMGREFGVPTANVRCTVPYALLRDGVYGGYVEVGSDRYAAAISCGYAPTFDDAASVLEPHLIDFEGDLYGREVKVVFAVRLRDLVKFDSTDELIATVKSNIAWVREHLV